MRAIVFIGHGELPIAMKLSTEMIAGENENLFAVSLAPEDGKEEFSKKLCKLNERLKDYDSILIFVDLLGGSPSNGAIEAYLQKENTTIITGMNLSMALTALVDEATTKTLLAEGKNGIKDIKEELRSKADAVETTSVNSPKKEERPFVIKNIRVDARGIHGQVATQWVPQLGVDRIIVIDDLAIKDETQKMALKMAKPNSVKLSILSSKKAVERLNDPQAYSSEKLLIIIQRIDTLQALAKLGFYFDTVNMGNVPNRTGTKAFRKTVNLNESEVEILKQLQQAGTHFTAQMVPNDSVVDFDAIIQG